jgi:uncharacterized damage-inducible protein DinB
VRRHLLVKAMFLPRFSREYLVCQSRHYSKALAFRVMTAFDNHGRVNPPETADELVTLLGFLDFQRATFAWKTAELDAEGFAVTIAVSSMTLGGMMKHLALVEDYWFTQWLMGVEPSPPWNLVDWKQDSDWEWHSASDDSPEELRSLWQENVERSRDNLAEFLARASLDQPARKVSSSEPSPSARWILSHMIEEYARHNGHADLLREAIDGETGE